MEGSSFVFDYVNLLDIEFNQIDLIRGGAYIQTPIWLSNKKATINPKNDDEDDNNCFMYAITVALNHQEIGCHPERISKIKEYTSKYNWNRINFPSQRKDWETFERDNEYIALNILSVPFNKKTFELQYKSKYNRTRSYQIVLLMITDNIKRHYLALKSISTNDGFVKPTQSISRLSNKITSTNTTDDYYCLNCFKSYRTESKLKEHELICDNHDYCEIIVPDENHKTLKYLQGTKCVKMEHAIYLDLECILSKHNTCGNNPDNSYSKTISTHEVSGYSIVSVNRHSDTYQLHYRGEDCMEKLACELMTIGKKIAEKEKKDEDLLTDYEKSKYEKSEYCHICHTRFSDDDEIDEEKKTEEPDERRIKFLEKF